VPQQPSRRDLLKYGGALIGGVTIAGAGAATSSAAAGSIGTRIVPADHQLGSPGPWDLVPEIMRRIKPPTFPGRAFPITRYGAVGDGETDCTEAFDQAIAECNAAGGGRVLVPEGAYLTGAIHLRSNVNLHLVPDATIKFSTDPADYLPVVFTRWEGTECYNYSPFIYAFEQENVAVTGRGVLDGQGLQGEWETWYRDGSRQGPDQRELRRMGNEDVPVDERVFGAGHYLRPQMMQFYRCKNILVSDVTMLEPAMWTVHPVLSENITVRNITVVSTLHNTDGVDIECSKDVHVIGCRFDTTDDCVVLKAGRDDDGHRVGVPSEDVVVENCKFSGRWGGLTVGSEMSGGVRNVFARNCEINPPDFVGAFPIKYPLYIKTNKLRGGFIEDIHLRDFTGGNVERDALHVILNYNNQVGNRPVEVRDITGEGMVLDGVGRRSLWLDGLATDPIGDIHVSNTHLTNVNPAPPLVNHVNDLTLTNVTVNGEDLVIEEEPPDDDWLIVRYGTDSRNTLSGTARIAGCSGCDSGAKVGSLGRGPDNYVVFNEINLEEAGQYTLVVYYLVSGTRTFFVSVNGAESFELELSGTSFNSVRSAEVTVTLNAGENNIRFHNDDPDSPAPDLERIAIAKPE
jgi:hypothetical protein